MGDINR